DLLAFGARARLVEDGDLAKAQLLFGQLGGDLPVVIEAVAAQRHAFEVLGAEELEHRGAVAELGAVKEIEQPGEDDAAEVDEKAVETLQAREAPELPGLRMAHDARAEDDLALAVEERLKERRVFLDVVFQVAVLHEHEIAGHGGQARAHGGPLAARRVLVDHAHARAALVAAHDLAGAVGGPPLDDDDLFREPPR